MIRIGVLSDTHSYLHPGIFKFFADCDEIWHAGDIGNMDTVRQLEQFKPLRAVFGNIDGKDIRSVFPETAFFNCEGIKTMLIHIGGYPGRYTGQARELIIETKPDLFICGHSHILKVIRDDHYGLLHINPGAAGKFGSHTFITMVRFVVDGKLIKDLEVFEAKRSGNI